ncbi:MAG: dihydroneopterin aldolase [Chthoniobacteraceae bacterium]
MPQPDQILISRLELSTRVGATEAERSKPQRVLASIVLEPTRGFGEVRDRLSLTVDYDAVAQAVKMHAADGERTLIETLAEEIAALLLRRFAINAVEIELRKFFLPDAEFTGVRIRRER